MPKITFVNEARTVEVEPGTTVLQAGHDSGIMIRRTTLWDCGGRGFPGCTCRVWIRSRNGAASKKTVMEKLPFRRIEGELRLACQVKVNGDLTVITMS